MTDDTKERETERIDDLVDAELPDEPETLVSMNPIEDLLEQSGEASEQRTRMVSDDEIAAARTVAEAAAATKTDEIERLYTAPELRARVDQAHTEFEDRYLRLVAEYENFRKRTSREKQQWSADALQSFVLDLLPVVDSFEVARSKSEGAPETVIEGLNAVTRQIAATLKKHGIAALDPTGEPFDPQFHEAFTQIPSPDHAPGTVVEVFEKGYTIQERLVRPARVVVAAAPASDEEGQAAV